MSSAQNRSQRVSLVPVTNWYSARTRVATQRRCSTLLDGSDSPHVGHIGCRDSSLQMALPSHSPAPHHMLKNIPFCTGTFPTRSLNSSKLQRVFVQRTAVICGTVSRLRAVFFDDP